MLIERIIFNLLAFSIFIIVFFKMISKNNTSYIALLIVEFIGILISFIEIIWNIYFGNIIRILTYSVSIVIPVIILALEKRKIYLMEYLYLTIAKILAIFGSKKLKKIVLDLIKAFPNSYYGHKMLAQIYEKEGGIRKSIDEFVKVIDINKKDYDSYYKIAFLLNEQDKKDESIQMLNSLIKNKPDYYKASELLGNLLCEQENFKEAIMVYKNALKYDNLNYNTYYNLGIAYTRLNDFKNAKICYDTAAEINSELYNCYYNSGIISLIFNDIDEAEKYFYKATKGTKIEAKAYYNLARINILNGEKENAINYLNMAIELDRRLAKKAINDQIFIPIKGFINTYQIIQEEVAETEETNKMEDKAQEHLENTYLLIGKISKNELKNMNSFNDSRIDIKGVDREKEE